MALQDKRDRNVPIDLIVMIGADPAACESFREIDRG
jgi:hypothetical protein